MSRALHPLALLLLPLLLTAPAYASFGADGPSMAQQTAAREAARIAGAHAERQRARDTPPRAPDPNASIFEKQPVVIEVQAGIGAPTGLLGIGLDVSLAPHLAWQVGAGLAFGGPRIATGIRPQLVSGDGAIGLGLGVSTGRAQRGGLPMTESSAIAHAVWLESDLQFIRRSAGWSGRFSIGLSTRLGQGPCVDQDGESCGAAQAIGRVSPQIGLGLGKAF